MRRTAILMAGVLMALMTPGPGEVRADEAGRVEFRLANGLRVRLMPAPKEKEVFCLLGVRAGFADEPAGKPHLAHVAEHVVIHGSRPGSPEARAMARWEEEHRFNGETIAPLMYFDLRVPPDDLAIALRVQAGRLAGPTFVPEILAREVPNALGEAEHLDESGEGFTGKFAFMAFVQAAYHGETRVRLGEKTRAYTVDDVRAFWTRAARPDRAILAVVGGFDTAVARKEIEATFGAIPAPTAPAPPTLPSLRPGRLTASWDLKGRHLLVAWPVPPASDPDHPALTLAAHLLAIRLGVDPEISALAKWPDVTNDVDRCFVVNLFLNPGTDLGSLEAKLLDRVGRLSKAEAPGAELALARTPLEKTLGPMDVDALDLAPNVPRLLVRGNIELQRLLVELGRGDLAGYRKRLGAVDARAIRVAAARHLDPSRATIVRVVPGS